MDAMDWRARALGRLKEYVLWGRFQQFLRNEPIVNLP